MRAPQTGQTVNFQIAVGQGALSAPAVVTDTNGNAPNMLHLALVAADVQVTACVAPNNNPCKTSTTGAVPVAALRVEPFDSTQQLVTVGQPVQLVTVRVTDSDSPPNPVFGAKVTFLNVLSRSASGGPPVVVDDVVINPDPELVLLGSTTTVAVSDINGLAQIAPWASSVPAGDGVAGFATVDSGAQAAFSLQMLPAISGVGGGARHGFTGTQGGSNLPGSARPSLSGYRSFVSMLMGSASGEPAADVDGSLTQDLPAAGKGTAGVGEPVSTQDQPVEAQPKKVQPEKVRPKNARLTNVQPENVAPVELPAPPEKREPRSCDRCAGVVCAEIPLQ